MSESRLTIGSCVLASCFIAAQGLAVAAPHQAPRPGQIAGRVVDFDNTPLPGIGVELLGPFPENTRRITVADADAAFVFTDLPPGRYRLSIQLPDVSPRSNVDVTVNPGQRTETMLVLSLQATTVNVLVQAEALAVADTDLVAAESTSGLRVVPGTTIENMPLPAEQALEVLPWLPTVVRGSEDQLAIDGTMPSDSVLLFNGIDLMDTYSGDFNIRLPVEAIDSIDVFTGVAPASYGNYAGGIVDITTLAGGESWDWGLASVFPKPRFDGGTIQGIGNASPRLSVSGPIKPGEAYVSLAGEYHFDRVRVYDIPGDPAQDHVREQGWNAFGQFDWRPNDNHSFTFAGLVFPSYDKYVGLDGLTPPEATLNLEHDAEAFLLRYRHREQADRSLAMTLQYNRLGLRSENQGDDPYEVRTGGVAGNHFHGEDRQTSHLQAQLVLLRRFPGLDGGDSHLLQLGGDFHALDLDGVQTDGTVVVYGAGQQRLQRIDYARETALEQHEYEWSFFGQDRWAFNERFWLDFGVRYSADSYSADHRFAPRVGAAWDPVGDRRTLIKGSAGIVHRRVYVGEISWDQLPARLETTIRDDGTATLQTLVPRLGDDDLDAPRTLQFSADVSHRLESGWLFRARMSHRDIDNNIIVERREGVGIEIDPDISPLAQVDPAALEQPGELVLANSGEATTWSVELTAARRIPTGGEFVFSYVRSSSFGDLNDFTIMTADFPDAIIRPNERAVRRFDVPHRILAWGTIEMPWEVLLTPAVEWRSGFPYSVLAEDQSYLGEPNSERFPNFFAVDLQATKVFEIKGYRITGGVKITNLTGHDNPRQVVANIADPAFGEFRNSVPLRVRAKFSIGF
jgi:outer membrane receptor for ferrienterochelin and colicin